VVVSKSLELCRQDALSYSSAVVNGVRAIGNDLGLNDRDEALGLADRGVLGELRSSKRIAKMVRIRGASEASAERIAS